MQFPRSAAYGLGIALLAFGYYWAITFGVHLFAGKWPDRWGVSARSVSAAYAWWQVTHGAGLFLVSVPFAFAIHLMRPRHPLGVALAVAVLGAVVPAVMLEISSLRLIEASTAGRISTAVDYLKFVCVLPLATWLAARVMPARGAVKSGSARRPA